MLTHATSISTLTHVVHIIINALEGTTMFKLDSMLGPALITAVVTVWGVATIVMLFSELM